MEKINKNNLQREKMNQLFYPFLWGRKEIQGGRKYWEIKW